jgi:hypothetical protein
MIHTPGRPTPGPWNVVCDVNVFSKAGRLVASTGGYSTNTDDGQHVQENTANANLIAATPDLLKACMLLVKAHSMSGGFLDKEALLKLNEATEIANVAIAKAKGANDDDDTIRYDDHWGSDPTGYY